MTYPFSISVGGIVRKAEEVLLVQQNDGANKGLWLLPGGFVEAGESLEEALIREVQEETGLSAVPTRIVGIRSGVRQVGDVRETGIYIVFEMEYVSGELMALDQNEISDLRFQSPSQALNDPQVIDLAKQFIQSADGSNQGLLKSSSPITTKTKYQSYDVYLP
ncbi:NUDIX domain-containing protein [Paenibacillus glycanilyticus]|uniref:NUDIX domain-containing protein n=1 Tax=Paenibacillus glycanilyticus TaxID=126569 RepID=UPI0019109172|nr:NUDIX hydrolase [Paenibacillus glycanilyticus]